VGEELLGELTLLCGRCSVLKEVRGRGLMFAELNKFTITK
jgi:acetylornithine/succinyldiaminopimelate/putrescine aminotransferase